MIKRFALALLLALPAPAFAQQHPLQQDIDSAEATVTRIVTGLGNQVGADAARIAQMQAQIEAMQKELDAAGQKPGAPAPAAAAGQPGGRMP